MTKEILLNFIKDKLSFTIIYFLNTVLLLLYTYLLTSKIDIAYPILLSIVIYIFAIFNEWNKYYKFNKSLNEGIENLYFNLNPKTNEQRKSASVILNIHKNYTNKISSIYAQNTDNKYFLSQWIHNIKTPTSVIDLIIQKSIKETCESNVLKLFFDIREENNKVKNSLNQILNLSRLNDFSKDYEPEAVDLVFSLKEIINNKKSQFIYNNLFPKLEFKLEKAIILTDKKWNSFMLEQIISNAIKYSKNKNKKKYIHFDICLEGNKTKLTIRDEGMGIPKYDIKRVFDPFFTGENGRKISDSTGIGLYICKVISKKLNHSIAIESEINKGTLVSITYLSKIQNNGVI